MIRYENEIDLYIESLYMHVDEMVERLRQIPPELFDYRSAVSAPSPRTLASHTYHWLVCDRAHISEADARRHALVPDLPTDQTALCDALDEENKKWLSLLRTLSPETLLEARSQFNEAPMNVRGFIGHIIQHCIYKHGQLSTIYFALGLDRTEPYDAPFPNTYYKMLAETPVDDSFPAGSLGE